MNEAVQYLDGCAKDIENFIEKASEGGFLRTATLSHLRVSFGLDADTAIKMLNEFLQKYVVHKRMIQDPNRWPIPGILAMSKVDEDGKVEKLGLIIDRPIIKDIDRLYVIWLANIFFLPANFDNFEKTVEYATFGSIDEMLFAGWRVD